MMVRWTMTGERPPPWRLLSSVMRRPCWTTPSLALEDVDGVQAPSASASPFLRLSSRLPIELMAMRSNEFRERASEVEFRI